MKIVSKYKDYYDFVGYIHGMDPRITYDRNIKIKLSKSDSLKIKKELENVTDLMLYCISNNPIAFKILCVNGKAIRLYHNYCEYKNYKIVTKELLEKLYFKKYYFRKDFQVINKLDDVDKISKVIKQPVFLINKTEYRDNAYIDEQIPILENCQYASIQNPYTLFQEIEHYITNVIKDNPDTSPPVQIDDKHKLIQHGFDNKQSFRHRK